jgi:hypothetical protein
MGKNVATKKPKAKKAGAARPSKPVSRSAKKSTGASKYDQPGAPWWKKLI